MYAVIPRECNIKNFTTRCCIFFLPQFAFSIFTCNHYTFGYSSHYNNYYTYATTCTTTFIGKLTNTAHPPHILDGLLEYNLCCGQCSTKICKICCSMMQKESSQIRSQLKFFSLFPILSCCQHFFVPDFIRSLKKYKLFSLSKYLIALCTPFSKKMKFLL